MGFARILKDSTGKPSGYRECDGEVAYMPEQQSHENIFRQVKIDVNTMEVLNHDFIKDHQRVYRKGVLLRGITPEGFHIFNPAYIGNHQVIYTPYGDAKIAHPESFEVLDDGMGEFGAEGYGRDAEFLYYFTYSTETRHAVRLRACKNPASFVALSWCYSKDDLHVYYSQAFMKRADPKSFEVLSNGYARDEKHIFFRDQALKVKPQDFVLLGDGYACGGHQVFYQGRTLEADCKTFAVLWSGYASDGMRVFGRGKLLCADPQTFEVLEDGYAWDSGHVFWEDKLLDADRATFKLTGNGHAEDRNGTFYHMLAYQKDGKRRLEGFT